MTGRADPDTTLRDWLMLSAILDGATPLEAVEAVASTALAHPEWDMDETRRWSEWGDD